MSRLFRRFLDPARGSVAVVVVLVLVVSAPAAAKPKKKKPAPSPAATKVEPVPAPSPPPAAASAPTAPAPSPTVRVAPQPAAATPSVTAPAVAPGSIAVAVTDIRPQGSVPVDLAASLTSLVPQELDALGPFKAISKDDILQMLAMEQTKQQLGCDSVSCLAEIGGALGVDYMVSGSLSVIGDTYLLQLQLLNITEAKVASRVSREFKGSITGLLDETRIATRLLVRDLLAAQSGRLLVQVSEEGAAIKVDGVIVGTSPMGSFEIAGGAHTISVEKDGFIRAQKDVQVSAKVESRLDLRLMPSADFVRAYEASASTGRLLAWIALGVGIVGGAGVVGLSVVGSGQAADYRERVTAYNAAPVRGTAELASLEQLDRQRGTVDVLLLVSAGLAVAGLGTFAALFFGGDDPDRYRAAAEVGTPTAGSGWSLASP